MNNPEYIIVHHTGGSNSNPTADTSHHTFEIVNQYHRGLWNFRSSLGHYIGYHYFIEKNGKVTQGRGDKDIGAHCLGKNRNSIGICLAGNFDVTLPTKQQEQALIELCNRLIVTWKIPTSKIMPHRAFSNKSCYGNRLDNAWARELVEQSSKPSLAGFTIMELFTEIQNRINRMVIE